jgi:hypothetical protein
MLSWSYKEGEGITVTGFGNKTLKSVHPADDKPKESIWSRIFHRRARSGPSGADPSVLCNSKIENEV